MVKKEFDVLLNQEQINASGAIVQEALDVGISSMINVGTSRIESQNCIALAKKYKVVFATVGIHPNDCSLDWRCDFLQIEKWLQDKECNKIVGIGECGIDRHYPDYNISRQRDAFKAQIELSLEHKIALVVHSRDAYDETLTVLQEYKNDITKGVMHCFSYDREFAKLITEWGFFLGIGGAITYPKNHELRAVLVETSLNKIVLETDSPFLPVQSMRGKQNHPKYIVEIAQYIADLKSITIENVAEITTKNAADLFLMDINSF